MDPTASNSFIPKKNLEGGYARRGRGGATGLVLLVAILFFIASLVAAGGVFLYKGILTASIKNKAASLELNEKAYDPDVIKELLRIDDRINQAQKLLAAHIAPSAIFAFLSQQTLQNVQLTKFVYEMKDGAPHLTIDGVADSFSSVALQSDQFAASKTLKDIVFSGVDVSAETKKVGFTVNASIVPSLIQYASVLSASPATPIAPPASDSTTSSDTASTTQQ
jgi:hypothetical protein